MGRDVIVRPMVATRFRARSLPRFPGEDFDARFYDSYVAHRALIEVVLREVVSKGGGFEQRLSSAAADGRVQLDLILRFPLDFDSAGAIDQIWALLPPIYEWERQQSATLDEEPSGLIARVARRMEFVDLPIVSETVRDLVVDRSGGGLTTGNKALDERVSQLQSLLDSDGRQLPRMESRLSEALSTLFCLPLPGPLEKYRPRQKVLFEELVQGRPAVLSLCLHSVKDDLPFARGVAVKFKQFLDPFVSEISRTGFAEAPALRSAYDRFALPETHLGYLTMRVAAPAPAELSAITNTVATMLGGGRGFSVGQTRPLLQPDQLHLPPPYLDKIHQPGGIEKVMEAGLRAELRRVEADTDLDDEIVRFLNLLPHVYTADEVMEIMRLPVADDEGLPGVDTRLTAPFAPPTSTGGAVVRRGDFAQPPPDRVRLGMSRSASRGEAPAATAVSAVLSPSRFDGQDWQTIRPVDLTKHALITGSTGSGKTLTTLFLAREMARLGVPMMIIEPTKTEYFDRLRRSDGFKAAARNFDRRRFAGDAMGREAHDFLIFDPMRLQPGVSVWRHCSYLSSCFEAAMPLDPLGALVLRDGITRYYTGALPGCGLNPFQEGDGRPARIGPWTKGGPDWVWPSLDTFTRYFLNHYLPTAFPATPGQPRQAEIRDTYVQLFRRRFDALNNGLVGRSSRLADDLARAGKAEGLDPFGALLQNDVVIELDGVPDDDEKALIMAFLLTSLFERRQADDARIRASGEIPADQLRHLLIVEEAHRVLANPQGGGRGAEVAGVDARTKTVQLFVNMLAEIRALGQGIVIVEQIPTKIAPDAIKNSNLKIMLRLTAPDDRDYLGSAMNFTEAQKRFVTSLRVDPGEKFSFVVFEQSADQPVLLTLPLPRDAGPAWLYDELFRGSG